MKSFPSSSVCNHTNSWRKSLLMFLISMLCCFIFSEGVNSEDLVAKQLFSDKLWSRDEMVEMAGYGEQKLSSVSVSGSVFCHACFPNDHKPRSWPIQGALVAVKCKTRHKRRSSWTRAVTDELGEFIADLPSHLHAIPNLENTCLVKVLNLPNGSKCKPAHPRKHRGIRLWLIRNGIRTYTAGRIKLQQFTRRSSQHVLRRVTPENLVIDDITQV